MTHPRARLLRITAFGLVTAMAACTGPGDTAGPGTTPSALPSAAYTGKWSNLDTPCPTLTPATKAELDITGSGTPSPADTSTFIGQNINCSWGEGEGAFAVSVRINLRDGQIPADEQTALDFQDQVNRSIAAGEVLHSIRDIGFQDRAYLTIHKDQATLQLWTLSSNASVTIHRTGPRLEKSAWDKALSDQKSTLEKVATEVLNQLG
ncbi:hypothetical protein [Actinoplanes sp. NPDC049265]|uniref:hypothetical protein n=1 Tax=Actinoplanes sp. NPDC049265 TaxID=3363902 RepID=UPI003718D6A5